jgi:exosome complex RNA-binding protein Rrp42 (RNase PH superfamily)
MSAGLSVTELAYARDGVVLDCRVDGRQRLEQRRIHVRRGVAAYSLGSALATIGATDGARSGEITCVSAAVSCDVSEAVPTESASGNGNGSGNGHTTPAGLGRLRFSVDFEHMGMLATIAAGSDTAAGGAAANTASRRSNAEDALLRLLASCYGLGAEEAGEGSANAAEEAATRAVPVELSTSARQSPAALLRKVAAANSAARQGHVIGVDLRDLYVGEGYAYALQVDVQVRAASAGNVVGAALAAVRAALADTLLPAATVSVGSDGVAAVHLNNKQRTKRVDASACPLALVLAVDADAGVYAADPTPAEEAALPFSAVVAVVSRGEGAHHAVTHTLLTGARSRLGQRNMDEAEVGDGLALGAAPSDVAAIIDEASGALAGAAFSALIVVDGEGDRGGADGGGPVDHIDIVVDAMQRRKLLAAVEADDTADDVAQA